MIRARVGTASLRLHKNPPPASASAGPLMQTGPSLTFDLSVSNLPSPTTGFCSRRRDSRKLCLIWCRRSSSRDAPLSQALDYLQPSPQTAPGSVPKAQTNSLISI